MATTQTNAGKGKKDDGRKNTIGEFYVDKADGKVMRAYVKKNKLDMDTAVDDEALALALVLHFKDKVPEKSRVRCDVCNSISHEEEERCPICGDEGEVEDDEEQAAAAPAAESAPILVEDEDEEDEDEEDEDEEDEDEEDEDEAAAAAPAAPATPATPAKALAKANGANGTASRSKGLAKTTSTKITNEDLDGLVAEIKRLGTESYASYYEFGLRILDIRKRELWKVRKDEKGKTRYSSFEAFVHAELRMSPTHAYNACEVAEHFKSGDEIREVGGKTKAALLLKAALPDRAEIIEDAKKGATVKEIKKKVDASREKHGAPKKSQQAKAGQKSAAKKKAEKKAAAETVAKEKITVASIEGSRTVKLYKRPEGNVRTIKWPPEKRATKLSDQPFGRLELQPGVMQYFFVGHKDGELMINVQTRREG